MGQINLDSALKRDMQWFQQFLASTNSVFTMDKDVRKSVQLYIDACPTKLKYGAPCQVKAYHTELPHTALL